MNYNSLINLGKGLLVAGGLVGILSACDNSKRELTLDETIIQGPVKVKLIQEPKFFRGDDYRLEIYDNENKLRIKFLNKAPGIKGLDGTKIVHDDGIVYEAKDGKMGYTREEQ